MINNVGHYIGVPVDSLHIWSFEIVETISVYYFSGLMYYIDVLHTAEIYLL